MNKLRCWPIILTSLYVCLDSITAYASYRVARDETNRGSQSAQLVNRPGIQPPWKITPTDSKPLVLPPWVSAQDFLVTRQMPLSSGQREVLMLSPSTKAEQRYLINLPDKSLNKFELYEVSFRNIPAMDINKLTGNKTPSTSTQFQNSLRSFKILFKENSLSEIILSDGSKAEFTKGRAIIKSPNSQPIETLKLSERSPAINKMALSSSNQVNNQVKEKTKSNKQVSSIPSNSIVQAQSPCQSNVSLSMNQAADSMTRWQTPMTQSNTDITQQIGWALAYGSQSIKGGSVTGEAGLTDTVCRPPVQCGEKRVSGGSEVRTDLFDIPQNVSGSEVVLTYEFFSIPDSIEMYYDGKRPFSVGPESGGGTKNIKLPATARQVGITLRGNNDPKTEWWYIISCSAKPPVKPVVTSIESLTPSEQSKYPGRLPLRIWLESSSGDIHDLYYICVVEKLSNNPNVPKPFHQPSPNPAYVATWERTGVNCQRLADYQDPIPGRIHLQSPLDWFTSFFTPTNKAFFLDFHGYHDVDKPKPGELYLVTGEFDIQQQFYWYQNSTQPNPLPLLDEHGQHVTTLIKRRIEEIPPPPPGFSSSDWDCSPGSQDSTFYQSVEVFNTTGGTKQSLGTRRLAKLGCGQGKNP